MSARFKLGYVGVGLMGLPMVKHLLSRGYGARAGALNDEAVLLERACPMIPSLIRMGSSQLRFRSIAMTL